MSLKAISADMILTSASTRADGSLGLRFGTAELQPTEKTAFFELLNKNLKVLIQPVDDPAESLVETKAVLGFKTPSQRLRAVLYRLWEQTRPADVLFEEWYRGKMESIIERIKSQLAPE